MALPEAASLLPCPLPPSDHNITYDCSNPYPECTNPSGFQFTSLFTILNRISECPNDTRLFDPKVPSLTEEACAQLVRPNRWGFTTYPAADIWSRLTTWKFPLLQLVAAFPRAPLSQQAQWFTTLHVLGNPISTIRSLLFKFASCQERADHWRLLFDGDLGEILEGDSGYDDKSLVWKELAIIVDSADEWGREVGDGIRGFIEGKLCDPKISPSDKLKFLHICRTTANALAADRSTKFLPIAVAQAFFIGTVALAFGRTASSSSGANPATYINIEAHSVAFSALYFWIIPAVILASVIGVSQSEGAIPRILQRFQAGIKQGFDKWEEELPLSLIVGVPEGEKTTVIRERSGGIYSWQPKHVRAKLIERIRKDSLPASSVQQHNLKSPAGALSYLDYFAKLQPASLTFTLITVLASLLTAFIISSNIPPIGFGCRCLGQLVIFLPWLAASTLDYLHVDEFTHSRFQLVFWLDLLSAILTMTGIVITQIGIFNRCICYTWAVGVRTGVELPEIAEVKGTLVRRISTFYPGIAFACIAFELVVVPFVVFRQYHGAVRVFIQRDDNVSNLQWWYDIWHGFTSLFGRVRYSSHRVRNSSITGGRKQRGRSRQESQQNLLYRSVTQDTIPLSDLSRERSHSSRRDQSQDDLRPTQLRRPVLARSRDSQTVLLHPSQTYDTVSSRQSSRSRDRADESDAEISLGRWETRDSVPPSDVSTSPPQDDMQPAQPQRAVLPR